MKRTQKKKLCTFIKSTPQLSFGEECLKFENNFAKWQQRRHCVFLNSGSSANLAIIQALLNIGKIMYWMRTSVRGWYQYTQQEFGSQEPGEDEWNCIQQATQ